MRKILLSISIIVIFFFISFSSLAQQNFFNVPSSDITKKYLFFFQQQINFYATSIVSNSTLCYGLGRNYEIGFNILGITYNKGTKSFLSNSFNELPIFPSMGVNAQKKVLESKQYSLALGGQLLFPAQIRQPEWYSFINNKLEFDDIRLVVGLYSGNSNYFGAETKFLNNMKLIGFQLGIEYQLIKDKVFIQSDFISGKTPLSNLIFGAVYKFNIKYLFSLGYQFSNSRTSSSDGFVFEITFLQ
ncbi:MAG: hypothetical protein EAZ07_02870 [Cytophagales bacterium]|nr:MAG: hypothetical protein EAZ07_02870 [Cytophagales bacterium]